MKFVPVLTRALAPMITDVVAGHVPMMFVTVGQTLPLWKDWQAQGAWSRTRKRVASFPDAPTFAESRLPGFEASAWSGFFAPRERRRHRRQDQCRNPAYCRRAHVREKCALTQYFGEPMASSSEDFARFINLEYDNWGEIIRAANIKIE